MGVRWTSCESIRSRKKEGNGMLKEWRASRKIRSTRCFHDEGRDEFPHLAQ